MHKGEIAVDTGIMVITDVDTGIGYMKKDMRRGCTSAEDTTIIIIRL